MLLWSGELFSVCSGILVPGGFGQRGTEGKILAVNYARQRKIPFLGEGEGGGERVLEGGREGGKEGVLEGEREGVFEGGREGGSVGGREGRREY